MPYSVPRPQHRTAAGEFLDVGGNAETVAGLGREGQKDMEHCRRQRQQLPGAFVGREFLDGDIYPLLIYPLRIIVSRSSVSAW